MTKADRIRKMLTLISDYPGVYSIMSLARKFGVDRSTIHRDIKGLDPRYTVKLRRGKLSLVSTVDLYRIDLNREELLILYLGMRLLSRWQDRYNHHTAAVLQKISQKVENQPNIRELISRTAKNFDEKALVVEKTLMKNLELINQAWFQFKKVNLTYKSRSQGQEETFVFSTWLMEPYLTGHSIHVIGLVEGQKKPRVLKLERIKKVELTNESYEPPADLDPDKLFQNSWGVWLSDQKPQTVSLLFDTEVAERVQENRWHPSEKVKVQKDGTVIWSARISELREMVNWILGWGKHCQVIEPEELKRMVQEERG